MAGGEYKTRGLRGEEVQDQRKHQRDPRKLHQRLHDGLKQPGGFGAALLFIAAFMVAFAAILEVLLVIAVLVVMVYGPAVKKTHLPARMPIEHGKPDYNDPLPTRQKMAKARGIYLFGYERETGEEIHLSGEDMLTHFLLFGTTGSGKTEALLSLGWNSLSMGSGMVFVDPKGTNKLDLQVWSMARMVGRDDDFLLINYSTGNRTIAPNSPERLSNTSNPFSHGTADFLSDILNSLIPSSEGENAIFSERALSLMKTLMIGLVEMRDQGRVNLSVRTIREWMTIEKCMEIMEDESLSQLARDSMTAYLKSVAGFNPDKSASEQGEDTLKQFGYAQAYFTRALSSLTDTYGHVYGSLMGEVDYKDVVFNRRILVALMPSMEKAPPELKSLAKVVLAAIRSALATGLGSRFEGSYDEMIESLPSASNVPNLFILDEYGYVATEGFAVTAAQARGLGASCVFAGQDYAGFKRGSETEAEQILANTKVKVVMALEDVEKTWEIVQKLGAEVPITVTGGYQIRDDDPVGSYHDNRQVNIEKRNRVDLLDMRDQIQGEFHLFHKGNLIRGKTFHADPDIKSSPMQINRMVEIDRPTREELSKKYGAVRDLRRGFQQTLADIEAGRIHEPVHERAEGSIEDRFGPDASDRIRGDMLRLMRIPGLEKKVVAREQSLVAMFTAFGDFPMPDRDDDAEIAIPGLDATARDGREAADRAEQEPARSAAPEAGPPGPETGVPYTSGSGMSLDADPDDDEQWEDDEEEDEAVAGARPLPEGQQPADPRAVAEQDRAEQARAAGPRVSVEDEHAGAGHDDPPAEAARQAYRPALDAVRAEMEQISSIHQRVGGRPDELEHDVEAKLEDAAEYPQEPTPRPDMRQQSRVVASLQELRAKGRKYNDREET